MLGAAIQSIARKRPEVQTRVVDEALLVPRRRRNLGPFRLRIFAALDCERRSRSNVGAARVVLVPTPEKRTRARSRTQVLSNNRDRYRTVAGGGEAIFVGTEAAMFQTYKADLEMDLKLRPGVNGYQQLMTAHRFNYRAHHDEAYGCVQTADAEKDRTPPPHDDLVGYFRARGQTVTFGEKLRRPSAHRSASPDFSMPKAPPRRRQSSIRASIRLWEMESEDGSSEKSPERRLSAIESLRGSVTSMSDEAPGSSGNERRRSSVQSLPTFDEEPPVDDDDDDGGDAINPFRLGLEAAAPRPRRPSAAGQLFGRAPPADDAPSPEPNAEAAPRRPSLGGKLWSGAEIIESSDSDGDDAARSPARRTSAAGKLFGRAVNESPVAPPPPTPPERGATPATTPGSDASTPARKKITKKVSKAEAARRKQLKAAKAAEKAANGNGDANPFAVR